MATMETYISRCLVIVGVLCLAACTANATSEPATSAHSLSFSSAVASTAPNSAPPSAAAPTALPAAANGDQLSACKAGRCEVVVSQESTILLDSKTGLYAVSVSSIDNDEIGLFVSMRGGGTFGCDNDDRCQVSARGQSGQNPPSAQFTVHPGAHLTAATISIQIVAVLDGKAVLRLAPGQ